MDNNDNINNNNPIYRDKKHQSSAHAPLKLVYLVWAPFSYRAENLSRRLGARLYLTSYKFKNKIYSPIKYPLLFSKSLHILKKEKPNIIICQSPPIFCALSALVYLYLTGRKKSTTMLVDAHTGSFDKPWVYFKPFNKLIMKRSDVVIVSNIALQREILHDYGLNSTVLEDTIPPDFDNTYQQNIAIKMKTQGENDDDDDGEDDKLFRVAVISSFAYDEPLGEVLNSASALLNVKFYITGDTTKADKQLLKKKLSNVIFTGFLDRNDYVSLLQHVDVIIVLTKRDRTMLSGAYEALAVEKPLITSNWTTLKEYFNKGTIYVDNSAEEITKAVQIVQKKKEQLMKEIHQLKLEKTKEWDDKFANFKRLLLLRNAVRH